MNERIYINDDEGYLTLGLVNSSLANEVLTTYYKIRFHLMLMLFLFVFLFVPFAYKLSL